MVAVWNKENKMKQLLALVAVLLTSSAIAGGEMKEVCHDKVGKDGKVVMGKDGKPVQECKTIKVHKKLEGTEIPPVKK